MDLASILGLVLCFGIFIYGVLDSSAFNVAAFGTFIDIPSLAITLGGSFASVLTQYSLSDYIGGFKSFAIAMKNPQNNTSEMIQKIIDLSNIARKEGLLSLEEATGELDEPFLKKGILLIVDGTDPELVRAIMETELVSIDGRHKAKAGFWEALAAMGPAWGMIGTLVGLVIMLNNMEDSATIGPAMATALITTLYGSLLANWISLPIAAKLKSNNAAEIQIKEIMIEGLLSIQAGENPRVIEEKLKSFLAPKDRDTQEEAGGEE